MLSEQNKYILYAEDDQDDQQLLSDLLDDIETDVELVIVTNGLVAIEYLQELTEEKPLPCFILLDINMPVKNGFDTLAELKSHSRYRTIPVIMYTTSNHRGDVLKAKTSGAEMVISKPFTLKNIQEVLHQFVEYCESQPIERK